MIISIVTHEFQLNLIATKCINGSKKINIKMKGFIGFEYSFDILDNDPKYEKMYSCMSSILKFYIMDKASICVNLLDEYFFKINITYNYW